MEDNEQREMSCDVLQVIETAIKDLKKIPNSRDISIAITKLEEANHRLQDFIENI